MCSSGWSRAGPRPTSSHGCCRGPGRPSSSQLPPMPERREGQTTRTSFRPEEITAKLRGADVLLGQGKKVANVVRAPARGQRGELRDELLDREVFPSSREARV